MNLKEMELTQILMKYLQKLYAEIESSLKEANEDLKDRIKPISNAKVDLLLAKGKLKPLGTANKSKKKPKKKKRKR